MFAFYCFLLLSFTPFFAHSADEEPYLSNVKQLTFCSMGFDRAGEAYFSPDETMIIFQAVPNGQVDYQMFVMDLKEGIPQMVSTGKGACTCGFFRHDGKKIIFASSHSDPEPVAPENTAGTYKWHLTPYMNIYEASIDGTELMPLTDGPAYHAECAYSPDGKEIVYASNSEDGMNLYILDIDTMESRRLTYSTFCYNGGPFFSPDGKHVLFRADREKEHYLQIYMIDRDGTNERQLTANGGVNWAPYWHPEGNVIAFTTSLHGHHQYEIYLLNIETMVTKRLTNHPTFDGLPVFNADGSKIMWTSKRGEDKTCQIFIADFKLPPELL